MYAAIWRHLPGPTWLKVIEAIVLITVVVAVCFQWVFPWIASYFKVDTTVRSAALVMLR
ncbi:hypothetical protein [Neoactinobaculum massilliense]|mgnify:CR=1 FL=1|uniref:hypothetical protein n=1 Tax=Neoactinobaculum massilliense TaxID=2364794 RepID=UPI0013DDB89D|nr:hypothetical protein [Neoactinobaculum massilliense]